MCEKLTTKQISYGIVRTRREVLERCVMADTKYKFTVITLLHHTTSPLIDIVNDYFSKTKIGLNDQDRCTR